MFEFIKYLKDTFIYFVKHSINRKRLRSAVAAIIVFVTVYTLVMPAIALEQKNASEMAGLNLPGQVIHQYACTAEIHRHTDSCFVKKPVYDADGNKTGTKKVLNCGKADWILHTHDESCYQDGVLVCTLPEHAEHVHTGACYSTKKKLICDLLEGEEHTHTDACYTEERVLTCGESVLHRHTVDCYEKGSNGESPVDMGWVSVSFDENGNEITSGDPNHLICGQLELLAHQHSDACFIDVEMPAEEPAEQISEMPTEEPAEQISEMPVEEPAEQILEMPAEEITGQPAGEMPEEIAEQPAEQIPEEITEQPAGEMPELFVEQPGQGEGFEGVKEQRYYTEEYSEREDAPVPNQMEDIEVVTDEDAENVAEQDAEDAAEQDAEDAAEQTAEGKAEQGAAEFEAEQAGNLSDEEQKADTETDTPAGERTISVDGASYSIHVSWPEESGIPENAEFRATALTEKRTDYDAYRERALEAVDRYTTEENRRAEEMPGLFDLTIYDTDGEEIQPKAPLSVSIDLGKAIANEATGVYAVHFPGTGVDTVMDPIAGNPFSRVAQIVAENISGTGSEVIETSAAGGEVEFAAESLSVYAIVYTVDFHYEVDGKMYEFSIPGGGYVSFTDLVEVLGIADGQNDAENETEMDSAEAQNDDPMPDVTASDAAKQFVSDVTLVEFSSPELLDISKVEADTTVGQIKESCGLACEYSAELTEEQIAEINAQTVEAGDWALISMRPFISEETLTVTMKNGEVFTIQVTDAQIKKNVIDAKGDTWEITVTYGPEAGIPEGTELSVTEYSRDDILYNECLSDREKWVAGYADKTAANNIANDSENNEDKKSESIKNVTFEPGFGDTLNYVIDGDLSDADKEQATSVIRFSEAPVISGYILFDISLVYNGIEIEPLAPVHVKIQSANPELQVYDDISVGHFIENEENASHEHHMETIDEVISRSDDTEDNAQVIVDFETSSFSLYDVTGIQWTANQSKTVYFALKTGINKVLNTDQNGTIPVMYSQIENMDPSAVSAYIRSLPAYETAEPIIIYDKSGTDFYAIDGDGNLARVYESGDTVMWNGQPSIGWKLVRYMNEAGEYTGYYDFINMETGKFLAPQAAQTISSNRIGVQLDGAAGHNTTIKAWDNSVNAYCGYSIKNNQLVTDESIEWFFASVSQTVSDDLKLQTVDTVDSTALGVTIKMFNYPSTGNTNNRTDFQRNFNIVDSQNRDWISGGSVIQGLVKSTLNSEGFPVATRYNTDLNGLFTGSNDVTATDANHLFIQQTYDETGYFEYSSFENYAHLESNGNFTVYRQIGAEDIAYTHSQKIYGNSTEYYFNRGNFLPYNSIADYKTAPQKYGSTGSKPGVTNKYDEDGNALSAQDPRNGEALFLTQENVDYFFGMSMEANFYQPVDGKNNGEDVVYEFNGDDDLWVFIDNVLVLDIGGCHNAHSGSINFSTGVVQVQTGNGIASTTIKQCFKNAGIFPDGTAWNDSKANQYFRGDTFADYSQHNMKMFYMERGAGASNLHVKFNLPVIKDAGKLIVDKVVSGTVNEKYSNEKFPFQVIKVNGNTETRFTEAVYESNGQLVDYQHQAVINGITYNDVFYLRPGEAAVFDVTDNSQQYYVKELGIDTSYYDRVLINREEATITDGIAQSSVSSVKNRNRVTYDNHGVTEDLRIKKIVEGDVKNATDVFEFYVYLTGPNNELIPYSNGDYYVLDPNGNYCTYVNGLPVGDSTITEATRTAYHSGQWGTIGSIPDGYTVLIPDLLVGTDFMVSERTDRNPAGYELKSIEVDSGTAEAVSITGYTNVTAGDADSITVGTYSFSNHCEGKLKKDDASDATVTVTNKAANKISVYKIWGTNEYVTVHGPVKFALYKLVGENEVLVENSVKTLTAPDVRIEYQIAGNIAEYVVREVVVAMEGSTTTVTPVANNGVVEVSGETTTLGSDMTDSYIVTYQQGAATANGTSRTDTVINMMPQLTVNKKDMTNGSQLANAEFKLTGADGETALTGYGNLKSDDKESGNLLDRIYLSNGTYYLVETKEPDGYDALPYKIKIVVSGDGHASRIFTVFTASAVPETTTQITDQTPDNHMLYTFNVYNNPGVELPNTGGPGTTFFTFFGTALAMLAVLVLIIRRRREAGLIS